MAVDECKPASTGALTTPRKAYQAPALVELDVAETEAATGVGADVLALSS